MVGPDVLWRNITDTGFPETTASRIASLSELAENAPTFEEGVINESESSAGLALSSGQCNQSELEREHGQVLAREDH
jgi:hypothetical protein